MTLNQLKAQAQKLGITKAHAKDYGDPRQAETWELAILDTQALHESFERDKTMTPNGPFAESNTAR